MGSPSRTPGLLAEAGIRYVCDWANDEQPYLMNAVGGDLIALPVMLELDDINALWDRRIPVERYAELLEESFETMYRDGEHAGRLMVLNLHPWLIGQPFRIGSLNEALGDIMGHQGVKAGTGSEVVDWYRRNALSQ